MQSHELKLIVSAVAPLEALEEVLAKKSVGGHSLGSQRESGVVTKQSIWTGRFVSHAEFLEGAVEEALDWLSSKSKALRSLDPGVVHKICCKLYLDRDPDGFVVSPKMAKRLSGIGVFLSLDALGENR